MLNGFLRQSNLGNISLFPVFWYGTIIAYYGILGAWVHKDLNMNSLEFTSRVSYYFCSSVNETMAKDIGCLMLNYCQLFYSGASPFDDPMSDIAFIYVVAFPLVLLMYHNLYKKLRMVV